MKKFKMSTPEEESVQRNDDQIIEAFKQSMAHGAEEFALSMAKLLYKQGGEKNVIFSPINIYSALALVLLGADGESFKEIAALMGLSLTDRANDEEICKIHETLGKVLEAIEKTTDAIVFTGPDGEKNVKAIINVTNGVFVQNEVSLVESYVSRARQHYKSEISNLDFSKDPVKATAVINEFVSKSTQKRIPQILSEPVDSATRIVLASCIYFKANWLHQFSEYSTKDENFNTGSENILVKMMSFHEDLPYINLPDLHLEAVTLDYQGNDVSMIVILPNVGKPLNEIISSLRVDDLQQIVDHSTTERVDLKLPRMKFKWTSDIISYLAELGVKQVFGNQSQLTNMIRGSSLKISQVTHAAEIEVDEKGTEASAATVIQMMYCCAMIRPQTPKQFHVNRPFLFYIHHRKTNTILFLGAVHNPQL